jgi:SAM-dependent methyltransferase
MASHPDFRGFYRPWFDAVATALHTHGVEVRVLVDLACGTGNTAIPWTRQRGWTVIGVDASAAMLREARRKSGRVRWYRQDMTSLKLRQAADVVTCFGDALNHVLDADALQKVFLNTAACVRAGGVFVFDMSTAHFLRWVNGRDKLFRMKRDYFVGTNEYDEPSGIATFRQTWFIAKGRLYDKKEVTIRERAYAEDDVRRMLVGAGFCVASVSTQYEVEGRPARRIYTALKQPPQEQSGGLR